LKKLEIPASGKLHAEQTSEQNAQKKKQGHEKPVVFAYALEHNYFGFSCLMIEV